MTTMINTSITADFAKLEPAGQPACFTTPDLADYPQVPIGADSPLFKLAVLISRGFERLSGPATLVPDMVEGKDDAYYPMDLPCCC